MAYKILALVILCALCVAPVPEKIAFIGDSYTRGMLDGPTDDWYGFAGRVADARNARHYRWCPATFSRAFEIWQRVVGYQPDIIVIASIASERSIISFRILSPNGFVFKFKFTKKYPYL